MWIITGCALLSLLICLPLFFHYRDRQPLLGAGFKSAGTLCAAILSLIGTLQLNPLYGFLFAAQLLHAGADFFLEVRFEAGVSLFLLGHLCYIAGFLKLYSLGFAHLILSAAFLILLMLVFYRERNRLRKNLLPLFLYGTVLSLMAAFGIAGGTSSYSLSGLMTAFGAALFFFSDYLLFRQLLLPDTRRYDKAVMITYYLAQLLIGGSCIL